MIEPSVRVRLQYLYPETGRSFFSAREFELSGDQISRTGLFGHAPDIAGVVLAMDSIHIQFNESDLFSPAKRNELQLQITDPVSMTPSAIWVAEHSGFSSIPTLRSLDGEHRIAFAGLEVCPECYLRLEWRFEGVSA